MQRRLVHVSLEACDDGGARIRVCDDGPGVDVNELEHLFEPFYTGTRATGHGAGVGLAITRRAADLHAGHASAGNAPGGGLVVELNVPGGG